MIHKKTVHFFSRYAATDPIGFCSAARKRIIEALSVPPEGRALTRFGVVKFEVDLSFHRLMSKYYFRTHEMFLERVFQKHLRPGDIFIDIGANCGYWSAFSANLVGPSGAVHAFEPVPTYFAALRRLAELNPTYHIICNNVACGAEDSLTTMRAVMPRGDNFANLDTNIGSSSLAAGFLDHASQLTSTVETRVIRFDDYVAESGMALDRIGLIKIDVEGYEAQVLEGMKNFLAKSGRKVPILCEVLTDLKRNNPLNGADIIAKMKGYGYQCLDASNLQPLRRQSLDFEENVLFV